MYAVPDSGRQCHGVPDNSLLEHGHVFDDPHGVTQLGRAWDRATQHLEGGSVRQVYVVRSGGVPEAAADVDGARQFKWSHVPVEGIQREVRGCCCIIKTYSLADSRLRSEWTVITVHRLPWKCSTRLVSEVQAIDEKHASNPEKSDASDQLSATLCCCPENFFI